MSDFIEPVTGDQLEQIKTEPVPLKTSKSSNRKKIVLLSAIIFFGVLLVSGLIIWFMNFRGGNATSKPTPTPAKNRIVLPTNVIPLAERPVVSITPTADGRSLILQVSAVKKAAKTAEYELDYQTGEMVQGFKGDFTLDSLPVSTTQLMGSKSGGGKITYHENVTGGTLLLRLLGGEDYAVKQDWKFIDNKAKETAFSSKDAKFQLDSPSLKTARYIIIYNSPGYPDGLSGTVVSEPYSVQANTELQGKGKLTMRATEEGNIVIAGFDGKNWKEFTGTVDGKMITAEVDLLPLFVVVKK